eukprot:304533_1
MRNVLLFAIVAIAIANGWQCNTTIKTTKGETTLEGTYNLCDFQLGPESPWGYYYVYDNRTTDDVSNYTYYFNIANNVQSKIPDAECYNSTLRDINMLPPGYCPDEKIITENLTYAICEDDAYVPIEMNVAAYQVYRGNMRENQPCWRLHDGETKPIWEFLEPNDPAFGITLTYTNGDFCADGGINREFRIKFLCNHDVENIPDKEENIVEPEKCLYEFTMKTNKGCPTECLIVDEKLCNAKGVCDYDFATSRPKCFCFLGYYGEDCTLTEDPNKEVVYEDSDNSYVGALVVVILLLMVILFILGYLFIRYSRLGKGYIDNRFLKATKKRRKKLVQQDEYDDE